MPEPTSAPAPAIDEKKFTESFKTLADLYLKRATLLWLADARQAKALEEALKGFDERMQKNFAANITGEYQAEILRQLDSVADSHVRRLLEMASADGFAAAPLLLVAVAKLEPAGLRRAFEEALRTLKTRLDFEIMRDRREALVELKGAVDDLLIEVLSAPDATALCDGAYKDTAPQKLPLWWYDDATYDILDVAPAERVESGALVDLNRAEAAELAKVPGLNEALAAAVVAYRERQGGFAGVEELRRVEGVTAEAFRRAAPVVKVVPLKKAMKKWTVLVFINADNNLEGAGLGDVNEMEKIGSTDDLNVVVQIDRCRANQLSDGTATDGNWSGARRYYVLKDEDVDHVTSPVLADLGERDMGSADELAEFGRTGVELFPAERYLLVVWNHGAGWQGISYDDGSTFGLTVPDLRRACESVVARLRELQPGKERLDLLDTDACLMALLEVGWELRSVADVFVASQREEPGKGMPYADYLGPLAALPSMTPEDLSKIMVKTMVASYVQGGTQAHPSLAVQGTTKSAVRTARLEPLVKAVDELAQALLADFPGYSKLRGANAGAFAGLRRFNDRSKENADLYHLVAILQESKDCPENIKVLCQRIRDVMGWRMKGLDIVDRAQIARSDKPGYVLWGINGWKIPPKELIGADSEVWHSRWVRTPLEESAAGKFRAELCGFVPIDTVENGRKVKRFIDTVEWRVVGQDGVEGAEHVAKRTRYKEFRYEDQFPADSPLIAEGHTQGVGNSHGIAIYFPFPPEYQRPYEGLAFARETKWAELVRRTPAFVRQGRGLVLGVAASGALKARYATWFEGLAPLDSFSVPALHAHDYGGAMAQYAGDGVVLVTSLTQKSFGAEPPSPDPDDVCAYLAAGGKLVLAAPKPMLVNFFTPFFREQAGADYASDEQRPVRLKFAEGAGEVSLGEGDGWKYYYGTTFMQPQGGAKPFLVTADGKVAGVVTASGKGAVVCLGFRLEAVDGDGKKLVLQRALEALGVK